MMGEKIATIKLVEFSRKTPRGQKTFAEKLKAPQPIKNPESGGDYWISALSSIASSFELGHDGPISEKIDIVIDKIEHAKTKQVKDMFHANLNILRNYEEFNMATIRPDADLTFLKRPKSKSIVLLRRLPIQAKPSRVFTFKEDGKRKIGAIWFVAKKGGLSLEELAIFTDILFRYLDTNYADKYQITDEYCIAIDVTEMNSITYTKIRNGEIKSPLLSIISSLRKLL